MAVFKLGSIVTAIAGSIGGTSFKRNGTNGVMFNKVKGASRSKTLRNPRLGGIASIFQQWQQFTDAERAAWNSETLNFQFPDKFGTLKNLTGRQFFSKLNIQNLPLGISILDPTGVNAINPVWSIVSAEMSLEDTTLYIAMLADSIGSNWIYSFEVTQKPIYGPTFISREIVFTAPVDLSIMFSVWNEFFAKYPYIDSTYNVMVYVTAINEFGFKTPPQALRVTFV